jgi:hypothetical protein
MKKFLLFLLALSASLAFFAGRYPGGIEVSVKAKKR